MNSKGSGAVSTQPRVWELNLWHSPRTTESGGGWAAACFFFGCCQARQIGGLFEKVIHGGARLRASSFANGRKKPGVTLRHRVNKIFVTGKRCTTALVAKSRS